MTYLVSLLLMLFLFLQACAKVVWVHPTKTQAEFYSDNSACEALGGQAAGYDPYTIRRGRVHGQCMLGKGWTLRKE